MADHYGCSRLACDQHPSKGDLIIRVSPKASAFVGLCEEHLREELEENRAEQRD